MCSTSTTNLTDAVAGGTWSSSDGSVATVGSTGVVSGVSGGAVTISYQVTNACGATSTATLAMTIEDPITVVMSTPSGPVYTTSYTTVYEFCASATSVTAIASPAGGTWTPVGSSATYATIGYTSGVLTPIPSAISVFENVVYQYTVNNTCGSYYATQAFIIDDNGLVPTVSGPQGPFPYGSTLYWDGWPGPGSGFNFSSSWSIVVSEPITNINDHEITVTFPPGINTYYINYYFYNTCGSFTNPIPYPVTTN